MSNTVINEQMFENWDRIQDNFALFSDVKSRLIYGEPLTHTPRVTIAIPTYKRPSTLRYAVESALRQIDYSDYEVIVVDNDNCIDSETDRLMSDFCAGEKKIRYYRNERNIGMFGNINRCLELGLGEWICVLHDDDMLMEIYLKEMIPVAESLKCTIISPFCSFGYSELGQVDFGKQRKESEKWKNVIIKVCKGRVMPFKHTDLICNINMSATGALFNKMKCLKLGGHDPKMYPFADQSFYALVSKYKETYIFPVYLIKRGVLQNASTNPEVVLSMLKECYLFNKAIIRSMKRIKQPFWNLASKVSTVARTHSIVDTYNSNIDREKMIQDVGVLDNKSRIPRLVIKIANVYFWGCKVLKSKRIPKQN